MADEYMEVVNQLWDSWESDAVVLDRKTGTYADYTKVRPINFNGKYYKSRGPLNTAPSPQGRPTFVQAGGSPRGRQFAAETADSIIASVNGVEGRCESIATISARALRRGRNPDEIKVLFIVAPVLGETEKEAEAKNRARRHFAAVRRPCAWASARSRTSIFLNIDLDKPLPRLTTNGEQGSLEAFAQWGSGKTLRQA